MPQRHEPYIVQVWLMTSQNWSFFTWQLLETRNSTSMQNVFRLMWVVCHTVGRWPVVRFSLHNFLLRLTQSECSFTANFCVRFSAIFTGLFYTAILLFIIDYASHIFTSYFLWNDKILSSNKFTMVQPYVNLYDNHSLSVSIIEIFIANSFRINLFSLPGNQS